MTFPAEEPPVDADPAASPMAPAVPVAGGGAVEANVTAPVLAEGGVAAANSTNGTYPGPAATPTYWSTANLTTSPQNETAAVEVLNPISPNTTTDQTAPEIDASQAGVIGSSDAAGSVISQQSDSGQLGGGDAAGPDGAGLLRESWPPS